MYRAEGRAMSIRLGWFSSVMARAPRQSPSAETGLVCTCPPAFRADMDRNGLEMVHYTDGMLGTCQLAEMEE